ncbi:MAG: OmpA family protein, partial [Flavobacteriales bacterium]|nr:OmpA family protein [Flavobacteriales bacterium]
LLAKKPEWKLRISGHTDNVGNDATNMKLSEERSKAVAKFLSDRGVDAERLLVEWHGEEQPIADNSTESGRQKNRRVEMEVKFD